MSGFASVTAEEAVALVAAGTPLVDVREEDEWTAVHAPTAVLIPMSQLRERLAELPSERFLVICAAGGRSARVAGFLVGEGHDAVNVEGGMADWPHAGGAIVTEA